MEIEPATDAMTLGQHYDRNLQFTYGKARKMLESHKWSQRAQGLEDFLRYLIELQPIDLMNELKKEREFSKLITVIVDKLD